MRVIPFAELDKLLDYFRDGYDVSHDEAYRRFDEVRLAPPDDLPADPLSAEYAARFMDLYQRISGKDRYSVQNERCEFDVEAMTLRPFPYFTKSFKLAAQHYSLIGTLLEHMDCPEGSDILEFGFGWGHTTLAMAMLGHNVTAVDIEDRFCELVARRAEMHKVKVDIVNSDFLWVETTDKKFDAIVFFESFHHCWEFQRLLRALRRVIKPGGKIYFGAEPINEHFTVPWGVRLDGQSLYVARRDGWMELGFHSDFFRELLTRTGWRGQCVHPHFWVATSADEPIHTTVVEGGDARLGTACGRREDGAIHVALEAGQPANYAVFGPYLRLTGGRYTAVITLDAGATAVPGVMIDAVGENGAVFLAARDVTPEEVAAGRIALTIDVPTVTGGVEIRLLVPGGFSGVIRRMTIAEVA